MLCYLYPEPTYWIFTSGVPALLYYAYLPITLITFFIGLYVYLKGGRSLLSRTFFSICILFSIWTMADVVEWTNIHSNFITFIWSFSGVVLGLIAMLAVQFIYVFLDKQNVSTKIKIIFAALLAPLFLFSSTDFSLSGFDITNCDAFNFEGTAFKIYYIFLGVVAMIWILALIIHRYRTANHEMRRAMALMGTGIEFFLGLFFLWTPYTYYLTAIGEVTDSRLEMIGLLGMLIFLVYISVLMIRFKIFNTKLILAEALVVSIVALVGAQFFLIQDNTNRVLTAITLLLVTVFGFWLARSVKKEVEQRENLEKLTEELKKANLRLQELDQQKTEFLSIASHQLRTPLSIAKGYIELIGDGAYGKPSKELLEVLGNMDESNERLVKLVDEFLDITRIEQGRTKYVFADCAINELISSVVTELSGRAEEHKLKLDWSVNSEISLINIDEEKVRHVVFNYVDNAIKYTPEGGIKVLLEKKDAGLVVRVVDTGLGFGQEDQVNFFQKFYRGKNVQGTNVGGTGLGLFVCRKFIEAHEGYVWAKSNGIGQGSEFGLWLPLARSKNNIKDEKGLTVANL